MLDQDLKSQLQSAFSVLQNQVGLVYKKSSHADQAELLSMLNDVASTSPLISAIESNESSSVPEFRIEYKDKATGVSFVGIPGGHEFTSLILAILNVDQKGKLPDEVLLNRIRSLKGPIEIKTYISLTCENCPDVVQALNLMAFTHPQFKHQIIDGAYAQDDITKLNIQGVPSVVVNNQMIHSGRITLIDLIAKLENHFGKNETSQVQATQDLGHYDVVVIGAGPAGASSAIYSVRKGLKTMVIAERVGGQVQDTKGIENLISVVYTEGPQLAAQLNQHMQAYPIKLLEHRRVAKISKEGKKTIIQLDTNEVVETDALIVATGAKWRELGIPGEKEYIGRGVAFCPHCDGPYYKGKKVSVIGGGNSGVEAAIDLAGIVREVVLFEYNETLKADQVLVDKLKSLPNVSIVTNARTAQVHGDGTKVESLEYEDRKTKQMLKLDLDGVFVQIGLVPNSQFLKGLVELSKYGEVVVDAKGHTNVQGIYAAGDVTTTPFKQIIIAMGEGAKVALAAFEDRMLK